MKEQLNIFDPKRWGILMDAVEDLADRLERVWSNFRHLFVTKTRDTSEYALIYLQGILTMENRRNIANISRRVIDVENDGQNLQQFISDSPWEAEKVFKQIQEEIEHHPELKEGMLTLDESGDKRSGNKSAGASRQYIGRLGKVDMGQVGVALGYYKDGNWAMVDAELFLPEVWFDDEHSSLRKQYHIPQDRTFKTKLEIGLEMIKKARANGLSFSTVSCDDLYGRDSKFRKELDLQGIVYIADIPNDTRVFLKNPKVSIAERQKSNALEQPHILSNDKAVEVRSLIDKSNENYISNFKRIKVRNAERGILSYECASTRVWTITDKKEIREEWLFIRRETDGTFTFSLSNASVDTPLYKLALWRSQRHFAERVFQEAKTEAGWDELVARKYRAWIHHTALDALALWFIAETKLDWSKEYPKDQKLAKQLKVEVLPALSFANVRELLKAVLPVKQLSKEQAINLIVKFLVDRARSTSSRLNSQLLNFDES